MLSEEVVEKLTERLVSRIERVNRHTLNKIAENIKEIGTMIPSRARELAMILKYGGDYDEILKELAKVTELNVKEIEEIFLEVARKNQSFARQFYDYKGVKYIPFKKNIELQNEVLALARVTEETYRNLSKTLGFARIIDGEPVFTPLSEVYQGVIDEAVLSLSQGKSSFNEQMTKVVNELASSGLQSIEWDSGYHRRLDSSVRLNLRGALRDLSITMQQQFGEQFGADGVEVSVHENPAPDHEEVQGHQFSNEEFKKLQEDGIAKDYKEQVIDLRKYVKKRDDYTHRPIGQLNCYHYVYSIVLGVSEPPSQKELNEIKERNEKGYEMNGKHYTLYQGSQFQRKLETEIRREKDSIEALKKGNLSYDESRLTKLTNQYFNLCKISGLRPKLDRLR